jgi:hypothetical protein
MRWCSDGGHECVCPDDSMYVVVMATMDVVVMAGIDAVVMAAMEVTFVTVSTWL